ncbi:MAG: NAD-dependent epimerase/dehydratase family protein, partial [Roseivirga sp.]|nr:NAD-dependent epimerase/dehydratase family protein [Roseivirga sp.]
TYSHLYGVPTTGVRFFTVYGPWGRPDMAYFLFTKAILNGDPIKVFNDGEMSRDFTYIDDIVEGLVRINRSPAVADQAWSSDSPNPSSSTAPFKVYNIGNNGPVNLLTFIETIEKSLGIEAVKNFMPMQPGDVAATYADVQDLIDNLGYKPETSLEYGVGKFVKWYKEFYNVG